MNRVVPAIACGLLALAALLAWRGRRAARELAGGCAALLALFLAARWIGAGHPPVFGTYETDLAQTVALLVLAAGLARGAATRWLAGPALAGALTMLHTFALRTEATPLTISERSLWIDLHAVLAWIAWGVYVCALCDAFSGEALERRGVRLLGWGFLAQSAMGFVGVYYGAVLFATPWSWDPVQTLGLLTWVLFAVVLHLRLFHGVSLMRLRYFVLFVVSLYLVSGKLIMFLRPGQSFHVFELGAMAGGR